MRYLFFDIECCNGADICEFGYIITDTDFSILEKNNWTVNPDARFILTNRRGDKGIKLFYTEREYYKSPKFPHFYNRIKDLLEYPDQVVIGFSIDNDARFIKNACERYELAPINFRFIDCQRIYIEYLNNKRISLMNAGIEFSLESPKFLHKSDDDCVLTMRLLQKMCLGMETNLEELISLCPSCSGKTDNFKIWYDINPNRDLAHSLKRYRLSPGLLARIKPEGKIIESELTGKSVSISLNYERRHIKETLSLVQLIVNHGARFNMMGQKADIFASYPVKDENGGEKICKRLAHVMEAIESGKDIKIISFTELLAILNAKEEDLGVLSPSLEEKVLKPETEIKIRNIKEEPRGAKIADLLKAQGRDLVSLFAEGEA